MEPIYLELEAGLRDKLAALAASSHRDETELIGEAVANYLDLHDWQRQRIEQAIAAANRGEFAAPEEVQRVFNKYKPA